MLYAVFFLPLPRPNLSTERGAVRCVFAAFCCMQRREKRGVVPALSIFHILWIVDCVIQPSSKKEEYSVQSETRADYN